MASLRKSLLPAVVLVAVPAAAPARAQSTDATLGGVVRSASKAPLAGATVTITNQATRASVTTTTGSDGRYSLSLTPGSYSVEASAPGLLGPRLSIEVVAGRESQIDLTLTPSLVEVVSVTATKSETAPIDVSFSVAARTGEDLRNRGAETIEDVAANVGSFTVQNLGPGQSQVAMRGVSAGQIARD